MKFLSQESAVYITGTDTEIGKTHTSGLLLRQLGENGRRTVGMKPVASGCEWIDGRWQNEDARVLMATANVPTDYALVNPYALPLATAPQIAARAAGAEIDISVIETAYAELSRQADFVLVEGVGGWLAPLSDALDQSAVVRALDIPVLLVVGMRLGCINHARLSEHAILGEGFRLLGWIANSVDVEFDGDGQYFEALQAVMQSPCVGRIGYRG